jgi:hypothetical protein
VLHLLLRYTQALITQMAQTAVCNRHHSLDQQLCRWLLLSLDRLRGNELVMTQELIANMLGVRREGVTEGAVKLQKSGLIQYAAGHITVLDRPGWRRAAASATRSSRRSTTACCRHRRDLRRSVRWQTVARGRGAQTSRPVPVGIQLAVQNHLIELLARSDRRRLLALCEPVELVLGQVLCEPSTPTRHVYFPVDSFNSLVAMVAASPGVEVGMVGREGMLGSQLALGVHTTPLHGVVQGAGPAMRIATLPFLPSWRGAPRCNASWTATSPC